MHVALTDYEKAFELVDRNILWGYLRKFSNSQKLDKSYTVTYVQQKQFYGTGGDTCESGVETRWKALVAKGFRITTDLLLNMILFVDKTLRMISSNQTCVETVCENTGDINPSKDLSPYKLPFSITKQ